MPTNTTPKTLAKTEAELIAECQVLLDNKNDAKAMALLDQLLATGCTNPNVYHLKGLAYSFTKDYDSAKLWVEKAIREGDGHWLFLKNLGVINRHMGDTESTIKNLQAALKANRKDYEIYRFLSEAKKYETRPDFLDDIEALLTKKGLTNQHRVELHFAAAKIYDDLKHYDTAFIHYDKGNKASGRTQDMDTLERNTANLIYVYSKSYLERARPLGIKEATPVFIVGMPRSGSSLMEQMIASHPKGHGVGELSDIHSISTRLGEMLKKEGGFPLALPHIKSGYRQGFGQTYLKRVRDLSGVNDPSHRVVDKQSMNFRRLGLITEMYPNAKIIHVRRDPRDTCVSCYFQHFVITQNYSFNWKDLARFYRMYERLMEHWQQVMPEHFITVDYENLVENFEEEARRVIAYIGLEWDAACLTPHKSTNVMKTASAWQVRQPVYTTSTNRWKRYEKHLGPLLDALNAGK